MLKPIGLEGGIMNGRQTGLEKFVQVLKECGEETLRAEIQDQIKILNLGELIWIIVQIEALKTLKEETK